MFCYFISQPWTALVFPSYMHALFICIPLWLTLLHSDSHRFSVSNGCCTQRWTGWKGFAYQGVWSVDKCMHPEWSACVCVVSLSRCVPAEELKADTLRYAEELQDSSFRLRLWLLLQGTASVCLSSDCYKQQITAFPPFSTLTSALFYLKSSAEPVCFFLFHLLLFHLVSPWGVSTERGIQDLSLIVRAVGCWGSI